MATVSTDIHHLLLMQVCAVTRGGAFAEEVCLDEGAVLKLPPGVDIISAAGVSRDIQCAHLCLHTLLQVAKSIAGGLSDLFVPPSILPEREPSYIALVAVFIWV